MSDLLEVNKQDVVNEIQHLFETYETALINKDVEVLDNTFWDSEHTIRYAMHENGYGFDASTPGFQKERTRHQRRASTFGDSDAG